MAEGMPVMWNHVRACRVEKLNQNIETARKKREEEKQQKRERLGIR